MRQNTAQSFAYHRKAISDLRTNLATLDALGANIAAAHVSSAISQLEEDVLQLMGEPRY